LGNLTFERYFTMLTEFSIDVEKLTEAHASSGGRSEDDKAVHAFQYGRE